MIDIIILFILTYLLADYVLDYEDPKFTATLFLVFYILYTKIPIGSGDLGIKFSAEYYVKTIFTQIYNWATVENTETIAYPKIKSNFVHKFKHYKNSQKKRTSHQFLASCPIDIFNNNNEFVFIGGGEDQHDALLEYQKGSLFNLMKSTPSLKNMISDEKSATYSAVSFDMTGNGKNDLLVARQNGVILYHNKSYIDHKGKKIIKFIKQTILGADKFRDSSPISLSIGDYNLNGKPDIYISQFTYPSKLKPFQYNNNNHWRKNILLENVTHYNDNNNNNSEEFSQYNDNLLFVDVTDKKKIGGTQNTFTSAFIDLSNSGRLDIVSANDTGKIEIFKNIVDSNGSTTFKRMITDFPYGFWMGLAVGDINNNGKLDIFSTNLGQDVPLPSHGSNKGTRGNTKTGLKSHETLTHNHIMLVNNTINTKSYVFENMSKNLNLSKDGIGWGCVFEDITLNGNVDLIYAQNYVDMPSIKNYNGAVYLNTHGKFKKTSMMKNNSNGHTPMFCNLRGKIKDLIWINVHGEVHGYMNHNKYNNNFISINVPRTISYLNCTIKIHMKNNDIMTRQNIIGGIGLSGDQSSLMTFGLGKKNIDSVKKIVLSTIYNKTYQLLDKVKLNDTLIL